MRDLRPTSVAPPDLIDQVMDRDVTWRERSAAVELAYRDWCHALTGDREAAYTAYAAALDREEQAACRYHALLDIAAARAGR